MKIVFLSSLLVLTAAVPVCAADAKPELHCVAGPMTKSYGGAPWIVHSCTDGKSLVFTAPQGSAAAPFEFDLTYTGDGYDLTGKGTGDRKLTDAAYGDLQKLSGTDVRALVAETLAAEKNSHH